MQQILPHQSSIYSYSGRTWTPCSCVCHVSLKYYCCCCYQVAVVDEFVYLGALTQSTAATTFTVTVVLLTVQCRTLEIMTCTEHQAAAVQHLHLTDSAVWIGMLGSVNSRCKYSKIDVLDQWCLRRILNICWYHEVWRITDQPPLTSVIQKRRLMLFGKSR